MTLANTCNANKSHLELVAYYFTKRIKQLRKWLGNYLQFMRF